MAQKMKLSEAILKGAHGKKQMTVDLCSEDGSEVCALGAIGLGGGMTIQDLKARGNYSMLNSLFPELKHRFAYPKNELGYKTGNLLEVIWFYNDNKHWTFKKISNLLKKWGY